MCIRDRLTIEFEDKRKGSEDKETFHEPDGLKAYIKDLNNGKETVCDIVYFKKKQEDIEVEVAFQFVNEFEENILGFCNNTVSYTHLQRMNFLNSQDYMLY